MKVVLAIDGDRISPVLDAARCFLLVTASSDGALIRKEVLIADPDPVTKAKRIAELGGRVLICGVISWPLEAMLTSAGMRVIPNTCGPPGSTDTATVTEGDGGTDGNEMRNKRKKGD